MDGFLVATESIQFLVQVVGPKIILILSVPLLALLSMPLPFTVSIATDPLPSFKKPFTLRITPFLCSRGDRH